jgi:hypothetical protein
MLLISWLRWRDLGRWRANGVRQIASDFAAGQFSRLRGVLAFAESRARFGTRNGDSDLGAITGAIQSNLPCRVALALSSPIESNMILGTSGAERLTGWGDLLYKDFGDPIRLQAPYLPQEERRRWFRA